MYNQLSLLAAEIHEENAHWWRDPASGQRIERNKLQTLFLICSEIVEAGEGERKDLMDDHLPNRKMAEVELADALIRFFDYVGAHKYDLDAGLRKAYPSAINKDLASLTGFFAFRYFKRSEKKPEQLFKMLASVARVGELEECPSIAARDVESALVWFLGLVCDYAGVWNYDLTGAMSDKRAYNKVRADHKDAARLAAGGKKW